MAIRKFAIVVDGDVAGTIHFDEDSKEPAAQRLMAALSSDPKIIESPENVEHGWTYDGTQFLPPL